MIFICTVLTIFLPNIAPLIIIYIYIAGRKRINPNKPFNVIDIYIILVCGYFSFGILTTNIIQDRNLLSTNVTSYVYAAFVCVTVIVASFFWSSNEKKYLLTNQNNTIQNKSYVLLIFSILPLIVSMKVLYLGMSSGEPFGSSVWRSTISNNMSGLEWLLFKSWVLVSALCAMNFTSKNKFSKLIFLVCIICLSLYGGRFLIFSALIIAVLSYISMNRFNIRDIGWRPIIFILVLFFIAVISGVYRYSVSENIDFSLLLFFHGLMRQLTGPVYDFDLSNQYVDTDVIHALIINKIQVSIAPFIFSLDGNQTIGGYLAEKAGRGFEKGHRISAPGESYYIGGYLMVIFTSFITTNMVVLSYYLYRSSLVHKLIASIIIFNVLFSIFIDFSHIFTTLYMVIYLLGILAIIKLLREASH
jgi:hypothetical protein